MKEIAPIREKWKGTLTDRERFRRQMHRQSVDRCFNMEFGYWEENYSQWQMFREHQITNEGEANAFFSFDRIESVGGRVFLYPPFEEKRVRETADSYIIINGEGLLAEVPKNGHSTIPHFIKSAIETPDDWKRIKEERFRRDDPARRVDIEALKRRYPSGRDFPLGVDTGSMIGKIRDLLTFEGICYAVYDYPDMVEDMVETSCQLVEDFLDQVLPHFEFDYASGWEDICFKNGPILSPDFFRAVIAPRYRRIHKKLQQYGIDLWYTDCDGDVRPILDIFLDCGINCLFPYEVNSCTHPAELISQYGGALRIMGGIDKMKLIEGKDAIRDYLKSVEHLVAEGGYIPFCDHRCPPDVSEENYLYYLDLKEKMFGMG